MTHTDPALLAAYVDRVATDEERRQVEAHLAGCAECRADLVAASTLARNGGPRTWRAPRMLVPLAAAAILVLLLVPRMRDAAPVHRDPPGTEAQAPAPIGPVGTVAGVTGMVWAELRGASRYRVTLYDSAGSVLWEQTTPDTTVTLPPAIALLGGVRYFWRVHARTGVDRWTESGLVEFRIGERP